jgi:hypothetical protein
MLAAQNWMTGVEYSVCTLGNVVVLTWKGPPSVEGVKSCSLAFSALRRESRAPQIGFLTIIEHVAGQGTMHAPVRSALGQMLKENEEIIRAAAIAFEGTGFRATVVRSVVTAIQMATRLKFHSSVFSERNAAAAWLINRMAGSSPVTQTELLSLIKSARAMSSSVTQ